MYERHIFALMNTSIVIFNVYIKNRATRCFKMIFIITYICIIVILIMLGDFGIFSDMNFIICLWHQNSTAIIHCVIAIHCCD